MKLGMYNKFDFILDVKIKILDSKDCLIRGGLQTL